MDICICSIWIYHYIYMQIYMHICIYIYVCVQLCAYIIHDDIYIYLADQKIPSWAGTRLKKTPDWGSCRCHRLRNIGLAAGRQRQLPVRMEHCIVPEHGRCCRQIRHLSPAFCACLFRWIGCPTFEKWLENTAAITSLRGPSVSKRDSIYRICPKTVANFGGAQSLGMLRLEHIRLGQLNFIQPRRKGKKSLPRGVEIEHPPLITGITPAAPHTYIYNLIIYYYCYYYIYI